jgi:hypothetical protein
VITIIENNQKPVLVIRPVAQPGPKGEMGVPGAGFNFIHLQSVAQTVWTVPHNLGGYPNVTAAQLSGVDDWEVIEGDVLYLDANTIQLTFSAAVSGRAFCS